MSAKKFRRNGHAFRFKITDGEGKSQTLVAWAKVVDAKKPVKLHLTAEDVRRSIAMDGAGNTQTCTMAVCAKRQKAQFPHPTEGYIDWRYRRAFVVSKIDGKTRMPSECVVYEHNDTIAQLNDSKGGQAKLLQSLERNGDRDISLHPVHCYPKAEHKNAGDKKRKTPHRLSSRGANLRFAVAKLGGVDQK